MESICPADRLEWRLWLQGNHVSQDFVWLFYYNKKARFSNLTYLDAVDEALCFGWIDSIKKSIDHDTSIQYFSKRRPKSIWSGINKNKVQRLIKEGQMTMAGYNSIEVAKENGSWHILDDVENLPIPEDLELRFTLEQGSKEYFLSLSKSLKKSMLLGLILAKRPETRQKRLCEIVALTSQEHSPW